MRASLLILVAFAAQVVVFGSLEVAARLLFPEFRGHITSDTRTLGAAIHHGHARGIRMRVPHQGYRSTTTGPVIVILGDSISNGFGMAFEDIYWVRLQGASSWPGRTRESSPCPATATGSPIRARPSVV